MKNRLLIVLLVALVNEPSYAQTNTWLNNNNGTVSDVVTGLVWQQQTDSISRNFADATEYCQNLFLATKSDWRLPNIKELASIVDYSTNNPTINEAAFPDEVGLMFWTSSNNVNASTFSWRINFESGKIDVAENSELHAVRCVR